LPGGDAPLPDDIADFVDEIHSRVDLFEVLSRLLNSEDEKVKQRALERILEMKYGKGSASSEEPVTSSITNWSRCGPHSAVVMVAMIAASLRRRK